MSLLMASPAYSQYSVGSVGLLNTPSAEMNDGGVVMLGANYLPVAMTPSSWDYNTANYFASITFLPFLEVGLRFTLLELDTGQWNQDRSISLKLRLLKERSWLPSLVVGSNDLLTTDNLNPLEETTTNRYFSSIFAVMTKNFDVGFGEVGVTVGGYLPIEKKQTSIGVFGGVTFSPEFYKNVKVIAEYNNSDVNLGLAFKFFNHLSLYGFAYDMKTFAGGLRYEIDLY